MTTRTMPPGPIPEEAVKQADEASAMLALAGEVRVQNDAELEVAGELLKKTKAKAKEIEALRRSITKPLDESKRKIMDFFRKPIDALNQCEGRIKRAMVAYTSAQERKRLEAEAAEREKQRKESERLANLRNKAEERGDEKKAAEFDRRRDDVDRAPVISAPATPKTKGVSTREVWKFRVVDEKAIPREYLTPDEKKIGAVVRAAKGAVQIPGVDIYAEKTIAARSG